MNQFSNYFLILFVSYAQYMIYVYVEVTLTGPSIDLTTSVQYKVRPPPEDISPHDHDQSNEFSTG